MEPTVEATLRPDWIYDIRTRCQEFHNRTFATDRAGFEDAARWLRRAAPASQTIQEADWLKTLLKDSAVSTPGENPTVPPVENPTDRGGDEPQVVAAS